ncbi:dehydrogenase, partial [Vibrio cholerae]|nr:dehydrogenase [Vibrio cholerae]
MDTKMKLKNLALCTAISLTISGHSFANSTPKDTIYLTFYDGPFNASVEVIKVL